MSPAIPQLPSGDLDLTSTFFERLGFQTISKMKDFGFLSLRCELTEIHFWLAESETAARAIGNQSSCYIRIKGIPLLFEKLRSNEVKFRYPLTLQPWGMNEFQIDDPFGNAIRFGEATT